MSLYISFIQGELEECWIDACFLVRLPHALGVGQVIGQSLSFLVPAVIPIQPRLVEGIRSPWNEAHTGALSHPVHVLVFSFVRIR